MNGRTFIWSLVLAPALAAMPTAAAAQQRAGIVTTLQGTATVTRASLREPSPLKFRDDVFAHDKITTGDQSIARILLGGKAVVTVREHSVLTITESPSTSSISLDAGGLALAVVKERMKPGESIEVRAPNAVAGVRGTVVVAEVTPADGNLPVRTRFTLLTGTIEVTRLDANVRHGGSPVILTRLQSVNIVGGGSAREGAPITLPVQNITRADAQRLGADYRIEVKDTPKAGDSLSRRQMEAALTQLTSAPPGGLGNVGTTRDRTGDLGEESRAKGAKIHGVPNALQPPILTPEENGPCERGRCFGKLRPQR